MSLYSSFQGLLASCLFVQCCSHPAPWLLVVFILHLVALFPVYELCHNIGLGCLVFQFLACPNGSCPFPGTAKKIQILCLLLCSTFSLHKPNHVAVVQLYVLVGYL